MSLYLIVRLNSFFSFIFSFFFLQTVLRNELKSKDYRVEVL